jgi:hypothetical protein
MKNRAVEAELFHAGGRTDMKLMVVFRNYANAPKNLNAGSRSKGEDLSTGFPE